MTVEEYLVKRILELEGLLEQLGKINTQLRNENNEYRAKFDKFEFKEIMGKEDK